MADLNIARQRSVDSLQRLYTVVVSLSVAEILRYLINQINLKGFAASFDSILIFSSFVVTIIPFYHGANRYLDATYVTNERLAKHYALMVDFVALFIEGIWFFVLAMYANNFLVFYTMISSLFIFDAVWVGFTNLTALGDEDKVPGYKKWAFVNFLTFSLIMIFIWSNLLNWEFWPQENVKIIAVAFTVLARTIYDYYSVWHFYYPKTIQDERYNNIPAPRPALPPKAFVFIRATINQ